VDRDDVRVLERAQPPGLTLETGQRLGIADPVGGEHLEHDLAVGVGLRRAIDEAHPAAPEAALDLVAAREDRADQGILLLRPFVAGGHRFCWWRRCGRRGCGVDAITAWPFSTYLRRRRGSPQPRRDHSTAPPSDPTHEPSPRPATRCDWGPAQATAGSRPQASMRIRAHGRETRLGASEATNSDPCAERRRTLDGPIVAHATIAAVAAAAGRRDTGLEPSQTPSGPPPRRPRVTRLGRVDMGSRPLVRTISLAPRGVSATDHRTTRPTHWRVRASPPMKLQTQTAAATAPRRPSSPHGADSPPGRPR
jgi:hypothetical protein